MAKSIDDKIPDKEKKEPKELTEKEFLKLLIESQDASLNKIHKLNQNILAYSNLQRKAIFYKSIGYNVKYLLDDSGYMYIEPYYNKPGFKK